MGLSNEIAGVSQWLVVKKGQFVRGKGEAEEQYKQLSGVISKIEFRDAEYEGKKWREAVISIHDEDTYKFNVGLGSGYGKQLLAKLVNVDLNEPVMLEPSYSEEGAKKMSGFFVTQANKPIKQLWTRAEPNGMPPMKEVEFKGQKHWDDTEQVAFMEQYFVKNVIPKLGTTKQSEPVGELDSSGVPF